MTLSDRSLTAPDRACPGANRALGHSMAALPGYNNTHARDPFQPVQSPTVLRHLFGAESSGGLYG